MTKPEKTQNMLDAEIIATSALQNLANQQNLESEREKVEATMKGRLKSNIQVIRRVSENPDAGRGWQKSE